MKEGRIIDCVWRGLASLSIFYSSVTLFAQNLGENNDIAGNCGARCLFTLLVAESLSVPDYRHFLNSHPACLENTMTMEVLADLAKENGLECELIRFDPGMELPDCSHMIAHANPQHFVILSQNQRNVWYCVDPPSHPFVLSSAVRSKLSGAALAVRLKDKGFPRYWAALIASLIAIVLCFVIRRKSAWHPKVVAPLVFLLTTISFGGCSMEDRVGSDAIADQGQFSFDPPYVDLGDLPRSHEPNSVALTIVGLSPDDQPAITASCGCVDLSMGEFNSVTRSRSIVARLVPETVESRRIQIVAMSSKTNQQCMAEIQYRVTDRITVQPAMPIFERVAGTARFVSSISIVNDPLVELARVEVLLSRRQIEKGFVWQSYREAGNQFLIEIHNPDNSGYEHAYLKLTNDSGNLLHPEIPIEWGEANIIEISPTQIELSKGMPSCGVILHSDRELPSINVLEAATNQVEVMTNQIDAYIVRIELSLRPEDDTSLSSLRSFLTIDFVDGQKKTIPFSIVRP